VVPLFNEQEVLPALFDRLALLLEQLDGEGEVILADDGLDPGVRDPDRVRMADVDRYESIERGRELALEGARHENGD
jgi:hypothetical protein